MSQKIISVVGARPNFMKVAPCHQAFIEHGFEALLVHTGQHYDQKMSQVFFDELSMPKPDVNLHIGSASHAIQTAETMKAFETVLVAEKPQWVLVAGDVNSTIACALVAKKLGVRVAHLEAGLRSFDRRMPEEINRVLVDSISDLLLTPSPDGDANLKTEGVPKERIVRVGNAMIDSLFQHRERASTSKIFTTLSLNKKGYALVTLHRPSNVDTEAMLSNWVNILLSLAPKIKLVLPLHPRTAQRLKQFKFHEKLQAHPNITLCQALGYLDFLALQSEAKFVLTDSGGIQEETTALGVPCLTARENTERPITIDEGTNTLVGTTPEKVLDTAENVLKSGGKSGRIPEQWDGKAGSRVASAISRAPINPR